MDIQPRTRLLTLQPRHWLYVALTVLVTLPILLGLAFLPELDTAFKREFVLPNWEAEFGFKHGNAQVRFEKDAFSMLAIVEVKPGGVFSRAGVLPDDVPVGYHHSFEAGFYTDLARLEAGEVIELDLLNARSGYRRQVSIGQ